MNAIDESRLLGEISRVSASSWPSRRYRRGRRVWYRVMLELLHRDPDEPGAVMNAGKGWTLRISSERRCYGRDRGGS